MVPVDWVDVGTLGGDQCDFCSKSLSKGALVPIVKMTAMEQTSGRAWLMEGPYAVCEDCQVLMGIKPGVGEVSLEALQKRHQEEVDRYVLTNHPHLKGCYKSRVYGPG